MCACAYVQESSLMMLQASLKGELEANQQQLESSKVTQRAHLSKTSLSDPFLIKYVVLQISIPIQHKSLIKMCVCLCVEIEMCELTAERHRLQEQLRSALEQQQRTSSSLQLHINSLQQERDTAKVHTYSIFHFFLLAFCSGSTDLPPYTEKGVAPEHISSRVWDAASIGDTLTECWQLLLCT